MSNLNRHVLTLFGEALECGSPEAQAEYLDRACGNDAELRGRVEALLRAHDDAGGFLGGNPATAAERLPTVDVAAASDRLGTVIGPYKLLQAIGEGGMGTVYMAEQTAPVQRKVALKIIKPGMDSRQISARFEAERQALALMDHPNIARVLDAGTTANGRPYFVMELVKGVPITKYCDERRLTPKQRLELFLPVCQAVQHAHQKGIIHRDLKPSNVLVAEYDDRPVVKVIDFGIAKATGPKLTDRTMFTELGQVVGTLEYMSPEQAKLNALDIDTRSDIYSLGVLLYELLTGTTPFEKKRLKQAAFDEILRVIREEEPPRPSTRLSATDELPSIAANRGLEPKKLSVLLRGELDWMVMKALEKDRNRRYETANSFGLDIQRYLADEPVQAHPPSAGYRLTKFVRRYRGQVLAASMVLLALVGGIAGTTWGLIEARQAMEREAERADGEHKAREVAVVAQKSAEVAAAAEKKAKEAEALERVKAEKEKEKAIAFRNQALGALRATTGTDVEKLLGAKKNLSTMEKAYLEAIAARWQVFARHEGTDEQSRAVQAEGHHQVACLWQRLGRREEARPEYERAVALREKLAADFPRVPMYRSELAQSHNNLGILLADLGMGAEPQEQYHKALAVQAKLTTDFPTVPEYRSDLAKHHGNLGNLLHALGKRAEAKLQYDKAAAIQIKLVADFPTVPSYRSDLANSHNGLGSLLKAMGKWGEAQEQYQKALAIQAQLAADFSTVPEYRSDLAKSHSNLGILLAALGKGGEAQEQYQKALAIQAQLAADFPTVPDYRSYLARSHNRLGSLLKALGKSGEAEEQHQKALAIQEKLAADFSTAPRFRSDLANSHANLGHLLAALDKGTEAREQYQQALAIQEKLAANFPTAPEYRSDLANSHNGLGLLLAGLGKLMKAQEQYRQALAIQQKLAAEFPDVPGYRQRLAMIRNNLGNLLAGLRKGAEAQEQSRKALAIYEKLAAEFPDVPDYRSHLAIGHSNLGRLLLGLGKPVEAQEHVHKALVIQEKLAADFPTMPEYRSLLANSRNRLGLLLRDLGKRAEAQKQHHKARALREKLAADFPAVPEYRVELGGSYCNLGILVRDGGKPADSLVWFQKAIETLRPVHEQEPRAVTARLFLRNSHLGRALAHDRLRKFVEAVEDWDRAIQLSAKPQQPGLQAARANSLVRAGKLAEAVAEVAALTKTRSWNADQQYDFACICAVASGKSANRKQEYADRAMELLRQAVNAGYRDAAHMKRDTDLDSLRGRADFRQLLAKLEKKLLPKK